jgi:predicted patatin/cPLA2 family phospholipase
MLAGAGLKVAFQAGVLQVWLDESGLVFDHADAVSAACFNLAMWTQGMSGQQIADNWRQLNPRRGLSTRASHLLRGESLFDLDAYRKHVFPRWGIDFSKIRASQRDASFNLYNFSDQELVCVSPPQMTEEHLVAAASLPVWLPPVEIAGKTFIDAIFNTASNLEEAIRRGADELWIIWAVSQRGEWKRGLVGNYFGIFEAATNHAYKQVRARIAANNRAQERGEPGEFGRLIAVRELRAEVPLHYLLNFSEAKVAGAVDYGVQVARAWCARELGRGALGQARGSAATASAR